MFDRVWVPCPGCGAELEFQSKGGPCALMDYPLGEVPASVLGDIADDGVVCPNCKRTVRLRVQSIATPYFSADPA